MIRIKVEGVENVKRRLAAMPPKINSTVRRALINTALAVRDAEQVEMRAVFHEPTRWTLGAIRVKAVDNMTIVVGVVDPDGYYKRAANYLETQIVGGQRRLKAFERALQHFGLMPSGWLAVPGVGAKLDGAGNMGPGQIRQILSFFDSAERWAGSTQNMGVKGRQKLKRGTRTKRGFEYFAVLPGNRRGRLRPGIYQRTYFGFGSSIKPILIYVPGAAYKKRLDMHKVARETVAKVWRTKFDSAIQKALAS